MSKLVIRGEGLGKSYHRGALQQSTLLRDQLSHMLKSPISVFRRSKDETFWALNDVSFGIREGEIVGLIGRNGAGKTTLLKVLSRITKPTTGWAEIHGRVGSLLEVGTGFHPELTGRENAFLSGAILGMRKNEITAKFDEIVAFAELEKFIDTPVKYYSSGMYVRLAFAVAAHLDPEILFVDEVLAVGDIGFQKKCLGKMGDVARQGRTVVLVSHNMAAITALSSRVIMMENGRIKFDGPPDEASARYYAESAALPENDCSLTERRREGNGKAHFTSLSLQPLTLSGDRINVCRPGCDLLIEFEIECYSRIAEANAAVIIYDQNGFRVIDANTAQKGTHVQLEAGQKGRISFLLHDLLLKPGQYFVTLWLGWQAMGVIDHVEHAGAFNVVEGEESRQHTIVFPGVYLCRFEHDVSIIQPSPREAPRL